MYAQITHNGFTTMPVWLFLFWIVLALVVLRKSFFSLPKARLHIAITGKQLTLALLLYFLSGISIAIIFSHKQRECSPFVQGFFMTTILFAYLYSLPRQAIRTVLWAGNPTRVPLKNLWRTTLQAWIIAIPATQISSLLLGKILFPIFGESLLTPQTIAREVQEKLSNSTGCIPTLIAIAVLLPLSEEIVFRGFIQNFLKKRFSIKNSILIASLIFAIAHAEKSPGSIIFVPVIFILSLIIGFVYEKERTILAPVLLHVLYNSSQLMFSIFL